MTDCTNCHNGDAGAYWGNGAFSIELSCIVDGHSTLHITDNKSTMRSLMKNCPLGHGDDKK